MLAGVAGPDLAVAVHRGGGFGFVASHKSSIDVSAFKSDMAKARDLMDQSSGKLPIGAGCLGWALEKGDEKDAYALLDAIIHETSAIWLSFGRNMPKWTKYVKQKSRPDFKLFILVSSVPQAQEAVELGADALIVQGIEAGGHGDSRSLPLLTILPLVLDVLGEKRPLVIAAGGIVTGSQTAAILTLGADAVVLGTALLATPEATFGDTMKKAIVNAQGNATKRTMIFDVMRNTLDWPDSVDGRALINTTLTESLDGRSDDDLKKDYKVAMESGDTSRICVWAGTSVCLVKEQLPAAQIVERVGTDSLKALQRASSFAR